MWNLKIIEIAVRFRFFIKEKAESKIKFIS